MFPYLLQIAHLNHAKAELAWLNVEEKARRLEKKIVEEKEGLRKLLLFCQSQARREIAAREEAVERFGGSAVASPTAALGSEMCRRDVAFHVSSSRFTTFAAHCVMLNGEISLVSFTVHLSDGAALVNLEGGSDLYSLVLLSVSKFCRRGVFQKALGIEHSASTSSGHLALAAVFLLPPLWRPRQGKTSQQITNCSSLFRSERRRLPNDWRFGARPPRGTRNAPNKNTVRSSGSDEWNARQSFSTGGHSRVNTSGKFQRNFVHMMPRQGACRSAYMFHLFSA